jgi:large subunit ribosomal protein L9
MKVILQENVEALGLVGEVVKVKDGYARNYLIPRGFALPASERNVKMLEHQKRISEHRKAKVRAVAEKSLEAVEGLRIEVSRAAGDDGKLFGSVTSMDLERALREKGLQISRKQIVLSEPIKHLGDHDIAVKVHPELKATIKVTVNAEAEAKAKA